MPNDPEGKPPVNGEGEGSTQSSNGQIDSIRVKLPQFWPTNPDTWFIQAEAQFQAYRITKDETKYCLVITALPPEACDSIIDILSDPPATNRYDSLKTELIKRHSVSEEKRLESLITKTDIGDRRPSELLRSMKQLAGQTFNDSIIKTLWLRKLPQTIHAVLVAVGDKPTTELADIADKIFETQQNTSLFAISNTNDPSARNTDTNDFNERLDRIEAVISRLDFSDNTKVSKFRQSKLNSSNRYRSADRNAKNRRSRSTSSNAQRECWYHRRFGNRARNCRCITKTEKNSPN